MHSGETLYLHSSASIDNFSPAMPNTQSAPPTSPPPATPQPFASLLRCVQVLQQPRSHMCAKMPGVQLPALALDVAFSAEDAVGL